MKKLDRHSFFHKTNMNLKYSIFLKDHNEKINKMLGFFFKEIPSIFQIFPIFNFVI